MRFTFLFHTYSAKHLRSRYKKQEKYDIDDGESQSLKENQLHCFTKDNLEDTIDECDSF